MPEPGMGANNDHGAGSVGGGGFGCGDHGNDSSSSVDHSNSTTVDNLSSSDTTEETLSNRQSDLDNSRQTATESMANSRTTAESLMGTPTVDPVADTQDSEDAPPPGTGSLDAAVAHSPAPGTGSLDAAVAHSPAPGTGSLDAAVAHSQNQTNAGSNPNLGIQTNESQTSVASNTGNVVAAGLGLAQGHVDRAGRATAASTLTNGNAGNLPAAGFANRAALADHLTSPTMNVSNALEATPYGPNAMSTQQLSTAANTAGRLGRAANVVGNAIGPAVGAVEGFIGAPEEATLGERVANTIGGGLKEADDAAVSFGAGFAASTGTGLVGAGLTATGVGAPAGAAVIASAPVTGSAAAIGASLAYDGTSVDNFIDNAVDNYIEPAIATGIDTTAEVVESGASWVGETFNDLSNSIRGFFR